MNHMSIVRSAAAVTWIAMLGCQGAPPADDVRAPLPNLEMFAALPDEPPALDGNPITPAKVELGKMLYFDPRLSRSWLISCNTCHNLGLGGVDLAETSVGHGWQRGPRNAPTVFNAVFNVAQFWDGRAKDLAEQAKGPVQAGVEMSNTPDRVVTTLQSIPAYAERFAAVFPDDADPVTFDNMARAIEAFEATLLTPSRFDQYLDGDREALTTDEREAAGLFVAKGCAGCHNGVNVGGAAYYPFGVVQRPGSDILPPGDKGRAAVTQSSSDDYVFRAPTLRNVALTPPYFHSGVVWDLSDAVEVMGNAQLGTDLTPEERAMIVAFLNTLTGTAPKVEYPVLPAHTDATPRPIWDVGPPRSGEPE
jgi:cytochrome c peroxidase